MVGQRTGEFTLAFSERAPTFLFAEETIDWNVHCDRLCIQTSSQLDTGLVDCSARDVGLKHVLASAVVSVRRKISDH